MEFAKRMGRVERKKMSAISLMRYEQLLFISAKMDSKITSSLPTNLQVNRAFAIYEQLHGSIKIFHQITDLNRRSFKIIKHFFRLPHLRNLRETNCSKLVISRY